MNKETFQISNTVSHPVHGEWLVTASVSESEVEHSEPLTLSNGKPKLLTPEEAYNHFGYEHGEMVVTASVTEEGVLSITFEMPNHPALEGIYPCNSHL